MSYSSRNDARLNQRGEKELEGRVKAGESLQARNTVLRRDSQNAFTGRFKSVVLNGSANDRLPLPLLYEIKIKHLFIHKVICVSEKFKQHR